jgi:hypothetical protein
VDISYGIFKGVNIMTQYRKITGFDGNDEESNYSGGGYEPDEKNKHPQGTKKRQGVYCGGGYEDPDVYEEEDCSGGGYE